MKSGGCECISTCEVVPSGTLLSKIMTLSRPEEGKKILQRPHDHDGEDSSCCCTSIFLAGPRPRCIRIHEELAGRNCFLVIRVALLFFVLGWWTASYTFVFLSAFGAQEVSSSQTKLLAGASSKERNKNSTNGDEALLLSAFGAQEVSSSQKKLLAGAISKERNNNNNTNDDEGLLLIRGSRPRQQRIALMFGGAPRTLAQTGVMTSHVVNVINSLGAGGVDIVDVFFHLNNGTSDGAYTSNNMRRGATMEPFTENALKQLKNLTKPVQLILHTDSSCTGLNGSLAEHSCCRPPTQPRWQNNFLQFAYLRHSYREVKQYERDNNFTYDWFVRLRPDVACFEPMPAVRSLSPRRFYLATKERFHGMNTNDYIFIVPRNLSHSFFEEQIMTIFDTTCAKGTSEWPAETTMFKYSPKLPYQALPFPCVHVMGPDSAECHRLHRRDGPSIPTIFELEQSKFDKGMTFEQGCLKLASEGYFGNQSHV